MKPYFLLPIALGAVAMFAHAQSYVNFEGKQTKGEWALSVASLADTSAAGIVGAAKQITQPKYHVASSRTLIEAGFALAEDKPPHALLFLDGEPDEGTWDQLRALFPAVRENPHYKERSRYGPR